MEPQASTTRSVRVRSPLDRARIVAVPPNNRSRVANGALGVDLRTKTGRRWRDAYVDAMRRSGGRSEVLCRSLASLTVQHEELDAALVRGEPVDPLHLVRIVGAIGRTLTRLGLVADVPEPVDATDAVLAALGVRP